MRVVVVPYDPEWRCAFDAEAGRLAEALSGVMVRLHHIGSTAIPGIAAKPIIDLLMEVVDLAALDEQTAAIEALGYEAMGEYRIARRRYFRKNDATGTRTHQVHAFQSGDNEVERHLAFRDYMMAHPAAARAYGELKRRLARAYPDDIEAYMDGKDAFVREQEALALAWGRSK